MTSRRATTLTVMPSSPLTLNDPGWKHATMSLRFDRVVCTASLRPSLTMSHRSSVKTGPPDSNRCLDRERNKMMTLFGVTLAWRTKSFSPVTLSRVKYKSYRDSCDAIVSPEGLVTLLHRVERWFRPHVAIPSENFTPCASLTVGVVLITLDKNIQVWLFLLQVEKRTLTANPRFVWSFLEHTLPRLKCRSNI